MKKYWGLFYLIAALIFSSCTFHPISEEAKHPTLFLNAKTKIIGLNNDTLIEIKLIVKNHARKTSYSNMTIMAHIINDQGDSVCYVGQDFNSPELKPRRKQTLTAKFYCPNQKPQKILITYLYGKPVIKKLKRNN